MISINWKKFEIKNPKATEAFETLCYFLFCRKFNLTEGIRTDFNQVGLETEPVKDSKGNYWGFQAKYFEKNVNYSNIASSIEKALDNYSELKNIIIYVNQEAQTSCKSAKAIEAKCRTAGVEVHWFLPENFKVSLNEVKNRDLAEFYFGETDALRLLSDSKNMRINTLLQSKEYIELNLCNQDTTVTISEYSEKVINSDCKLHLFSGAAGSGKSVCMRKLFNIYSGFNCETKEEQIEIINKFGAICIFVNLNKTSLDSLESIILAYKSIYSVDSPDNKFIYLFDGFDEIPNNSVTPTILFIEELLEKSSTKKVIVSCRLSSYNKFMLKADFDDLLEYTIGNLKQEQIQMYFQNKGDADRTEKLNELCVDDKKVYENVTDILTLTLLWEYIFQITDTNFLPELMELSISNTLNDVHHKKSLDMMNLPNPKVKAVVEINKKLAFYLFENDKYCFTQEELNKIISKEYPKCDYNDVNQIVYFLADNFFDVSITEGVQTFAYRHRRFSEYFTLLCIDNEMQKDMNYLRKKNIIINQDLFDKMLVPYLHSKAKKNKDLPLAFEVGLLNVYMGNDNAWGVDNAFYYWSNWIIYAIAALPENIFQNVVEDGSLPICKFFSETPQKIISILTNNERPYFHSDFNQYYINYTLLIALLHKLGKKDFIGALLIKYEEIKEISKEKGYSFNSTSNRENFLVWENIFYIETVVYNDNLEEIVTGFVGNSSDMNINTLLKQDISTDVLMLYSLYYNLLIYHKGMCVEIIPQLNENQMSIFMLAATKAECLYVIFKNSEIKEALVKWFDNEINNTELSAVLCLALKKRLGLSLSEREKTVVSTYLENNHFRSHYIFWKEYSDMVGFILSTFSESIDLSHLELGVKEYISAYDIYMKLLDGSSTIFGFTSRIKQHFYSKSDATYHIRILLGKALALCEEKDAVIKSAIDYLNYEMKNGGLLIVYHTMKLHNEKRFNMVISGSALKQLNDPKIYRDIGYASTSDSLFILAFIASSHDESFSYNVLLKGLCNGMLRMNESKDTIGDYRLLDSLEEILKQNILTTEQLIIYLDRIILIANKMNKYHIDNDVHGKTMDLLQEYDFEAAEYYYGQVSSYMETYNQIHYKFAMGLAYRGRDVEKIENVLSNITYSFDNYYQKVDMDIFYLKISVYLHIAMCDFYSNTIKDKYFEKAREEVNALETAGWDRELKTEEYDIYVNLCNQHQIEVDVNKEREYEYSVTSVERETDSLEKLKEVTSVEKLKEFIVKMDRGCRVDSFEINEMLIKKSIDLTGNIDDILMLMKNKYYPSSIAGSINSINFWMTVVAALKNPKAKGSMLDYLLEYGGGHDGFSELIKIFGEMKQKEICMEAFDTLMKCVEFLLYD